LKLQQHMKVMCAYNNITIRLLYKIIFHNVILNGMTDAPARCDNAFVCDYEFKNKRILYLL